MNWLYSRDLLVSFSYRKAFFGGWKLVHGDVFRKPNFSTLLSVLTGSGMQLLGMSMARTPSGAYREK